ncbi:putative lovastatin nonaketide synthase [Amylocarpus encephaloides]|uniref:Lovastatin nonaketide synthase n=1 Tax=Amylocarpus encephaloides TaxID=45428 RepID=A0A9P7YR53_9HELO|nr:putative lovastatin nonaketide synthase [Amylocarpus encephaloides]
MTSYDSRAATDALSDSNNQSGATSTNATSVSSQEEVGPHIPENTAIVGMACRLPGARSPQSLWKNIVEQRDVQRKIPKERWNVDAFYHPEGTNKGTTNARYGYFLDDDVSEFDPEFFQISGKEAEAMDPQQRLLLEVVYEALENAGITLDEISGTETSVFCGSFTNDYREMIHKDLEHYPKYSVTGTGAAILANRISYFYNLHGPSVTLDTACSSSLVGLHMGNQSIRDGEADISIVVGSALHFDPTIYTTMTDLGFLSVDGRCRAFDAGGSGYVRGEGICAVVLKRKSQAEMDGNNIRAIVRGTGCNHDGIKEGITMPNSVAQEALIRRVYKNTGLNTNETQYFEAHGTGTQAGDPRETRAIGAVFAPNRDKPLYVGSVKTNIGHLEGASGLAGVIKTTMSLEAGKILPNMLFNNPNPKIDFEQWKISVPTKMIDWEPTNGVRRASVNSFGYGGTNAHIILEGYHKPAAIEEAVTLPAEYAGMVTERPYLLPLTSHTEKAGNLLKNNLSTFIAGEDVSAADAALSLSNPGISKHQYRSYVIGQDQDAVIERLTTTGGTPWTRATKTKPRIGYVFTVFKTLEQPPAWSCLTELLKSKDDSLVNGIEFSSSLSTAIQLSTVDLLRHWGIEPVAVCGHSAGEIPASYAAGILSFEDALACAYYRGCALSTEPKDKIQIPGAMIAVGMTEAECIVELEPYTGKICIAAVNSPTSLTLSGDEPEVVELLKALEARKVFVRRLAVERAYHSHHIAPYGPELTRLSRKVRPHPATCRMFSSVSARLAEWQKMDGSYYTSNLVKQVRFSDALTGICLDENEQQNVDVLIEIGAHPALKGPSRQTTQALKLEIPYLGTIARGAQDFEGVLATVGQLYAMGYPVDLEAVNSDLFMGTDRSVVKVPAGKKVDLPSYSWDHSSKYWAETRLVKSYRNRAHRHSILGAPMLGNIEKHPRWRSFLRPRELQWIPHHQIDGKVIFPAAGYLTMAIEAAVRLETCPKNIKSITLRDISIKSALTVSDSEMGTEVLFEMQPVSTSAKRTSDTDFRFIINSFGENGIVNEHCYGLISVEAGDAVAVETGAPTPSLAQLRKRSDRCTPAHKFYEHLYAIGLQYGEDFQLITGNVDSGSGYSMAPISLKPAALMTTDNDHCVVHPSFLDASFHPFFAGIESLLGRPLDGPFVPTFMKSMKVSGAFYNMTQQTAEHSLWATAETKLPGPRVAISDITIRTPDCSEVLIDIKGLEATALGSSTADTERQLFFRTRWQPSFDSLASTKELAAMKSIAELADVYAHQHPDTKILHITPDLATTQELLTTLGGKGTQRRRFQTITPYSGSEEPVESVEVLTTAYASLVDTAAPTAGAYDLVVVSKSTAVDVKSFLNDTGCVVVAGAEYEGQGMGVIFKQASFTAYREPYTTNHTSKPLTLVMGSRVSANTEALAQLISSKQNAPVTRMNFIDMVGNAPATENVIILASLDQELFFEDPEHESVHFEAVRSLFTSEDKNIVWLVRGASMETSNPAQAMILGMSRVARNENEKLKVITLDLAQTTENPEVLQRVTEILDSRLTEDEFALRNGTMFIPKIENDSFLNAKLPENSGGDSVMQEFGAGEPLALKIGKVGLLETLAFGVDEDIVDSELAADSIEVEVRASAINFRDVAASIGIIDDYRLGDECAGVVLRVGSDVNPNDFQVGDRVVAFRPGQGAHRSIVREQAALCYKLPENISFTTAAAFTCIMITAYYAFHDLARLQPGEKVLIHAAAGGVGQMAIQVAQMMGAEVIATCGSQAKRDLLKSTYGLTDDHIFSSRDPSFVKDILNLTHGKGVDVVLNSLAGDLLHATWNCVARFGRFIEIGKRDIHENAKIDMEPFRKSVGFASLDLITMYEYNKPLSHRLLNETYKLLEAGKINNPQTVLELPYSEAEKGFRLLQMGKHTGKIVLVPHKDDIVPVSQPSYRKTMLFSANKTYLLSGGLGGLGRTMAEWMVRKGARQLAFMSRSGDARSEAKATVEWLEARDVKVTIFKVDVSDYAAVTAAVKSLGDSLAGIFHAAVVLQDAPLNTMSLKQWQGCVHPKVQGAWNLHRATLHLNLDFFIPFSSVACQVGAMGQTNYAAANTYLDALVRHRRETGLKASSMNCGMIVGVGLVAENTDILNWLIKMGSDGVNEDELLYQIEEAVVGGDASNKFSARGVDPAATTTGVQTKRNDVYWHARAFFRNLYSNFDQDGSAASKSGNSLGASLKAAKDVPERAEILTGAFIDKIAAVLGVAADIIQPSNPLSQYGLDSIVAVEFRKWFSKTINVDIALFDILSSKSISALVLKAAGLMVFEAAASETSKGSSKDPKAEGNAGTSEQTTGAEQSSDFDAISIARPANIPMSTFQRRMWFSHQMVEDKSALNICITSYIKGTPDVNIFKAALDELKRRNEMLRTAYSEGDDFAEQEPIVDFDSRLVFKDLATEIDVDASLEQWRASLQDEELDIENGEIMRPGLFKLGDDRFAFVIVFHHISIDRGSSKALFEQFVEIYDAIRLEKDLTTIPLPRISYIDFSIWYENHLQSEGLQSEVKFWKQKLAGIKPTSQLLPFAQSARPETMDRARSELRSSLPIEMLKRLKRVCTRMGTTPFQFLLASFRAFLYRYTEEEDVTVLVIDGNRPRSDLEDVLGFFVNMIPVRLNKNLDDAFEHLLGATKASTVEAIGHSKIPFDSIVDAVNLPKSQSIFPISQVVVNYQMHGKMPRFPTEDFEINRVVNHDIPTACELALEALEDPDKGLDLRLEYSTTLYAEADMDRFFDNFSTFLTSLIQDHRQPISTVKMTGPKEVEHLKANYFNMGFTKNTWNGASVVEKILHKAETTPEAVAIQTAENGKLTYKQLVDQAQRVAATLEQASILPGTSVGVLASPGADAVVAMTGALLRGCGYLAMDPEFAAQRLSFMASDSAVKLVLVGDELESLGCAVASKATSPPQIMPIAIAKSSNEKSRYGDTSADFPFYTIYTSGSTGKPKGVVLTQSNTQQMLSTLEHDYSFTSNDKFLHQSSMCFDLSIVQIFSALTSGATVCIASTPIRKDPARLAKFIQDTGVTVTYFTPTHFALLIESSAPIFRLCANYRIAFFAGERLSARLVDKFRGLKTPATILNTWSPSELVVQTTIHKVAESETGDVNIPIGFPMANCRHYILDTQMNPLPAGLIGEICVGGAQVGAGYLNRPEANAASFAQDPFCSENDISRGWTRLFRTGDKGRFLPDGKLEFHGRIAGDKQIKLRGFRIDLGEVEHRVYLQASKMTGPKLVDISMVARTLDGSQSYTDDRQLIAFIVCNQELTSQQQVKYVTTIHQEIAKDLNPYMLPGGYQFLLELPVTIGRKVDRQNLLSRALKLVYPSTKSSDATQEANLGGEQQKVLATIFQLYREVLKLPKDREIGAGDNFFELGGQSILLLRLQSKLKRNYKKATPSLPELFKAPTPLAISQKICGLPATPAAGTLTTAAPKQIINWHSEASLPSDMRYLVTYGASTLCASDITDVLVTGVESFIGLHVFANMLSTKSFKTFYLLGSEKPIEINDVIADLRQFKLLSNKVTESLAKSQVTIIPGSLMQPGFGLDKTSFTQLGRSIQAIYHLGGRMSLLKNYETLRRANSGATMDLIELAACGIHRTELHYLSTWSVPHLQSHGAAKRNLTHIDITESSSEHFQPSSDAELFYFKSRWVSEMLLTRAAERGFNISIFRASAVSGSTATNVPAPDDDFVRRMILDMVTLGSVPDLHGAEGSPAYAVDFIPVNYLASAIQSITTSDALKDEKTFNKKNLSIFHIGNPKPMLLHDLPQLMTTLRADKKAGKLISLQEWLGEMKAKASTEEDTLRWEAVKNVCETGHVMFALDQSQTLKALGEVDAGLSCPPMDTAFLKMLGA